MDTNARIPGPVRCFGTGDPLYEAYHDDEWGREVRGDDALFERLCLEAFQSGLAWITVLRKRPAFREAFAGFSVAAVAEFGDDDVERLLADEGIIRNRLKITAAINNAKAIKALQAEGGSLTELIWSHAPAERRGGSSEPGAGMVSQTPESVALAKSLKKVGLKFVGPTTMYALMQACGLVDDHIEGCIARIA